METQERNHLADKKRIVIKIGSSSLTHEKTGEVNLMKIEKLVRVISDLRHWDTGAVLTALPKSRPLQRWDRPGL